MPMRWVLPGGATLGGSNRGDNERAVAFRPLAAVREQKIPRKTGRLQTIKLVFDSWARWLLLAIRVRKEHLETIKLVLEIGVALLALIGGIIALFWGSR
jgi:hypothetical protein